jgi:hypothetical protein
MADDSIRIEYNLDLKPLEELLEGVEWAGYFFVSGAMEIPMPKVEVTGVDVLSFPDPPVAGLHQRPPDIQTPLRAIPEGHRRARCAGGVGGQRPTDRRIESKDCNRSHPFRPVVAGRSMKAIQDHHLIKPRDMR